MRGARPGRALEQNIELGEVLRPGESVLIACSGGPDSVALAAALTRIANPMALRLTLGHVNHGVRHSAWQDEAVVLRVSAALNLPVRISAPQIEGRDEAALRSARYQALERLARDADAGVVVTGHSAEDQSETVLLALFRGTGPGGLAGMPARRVLSEGVDLARPFLAVPRAEIRRYVEGLGLPYAMDPSNEDVDLRRNAVRQALGELRPLFPGLDSAIARAAELVAAEMGGTPRAALRRQVRETLEQHDALRGVGFRHIEAAVRTLARGGSGHFSMGDGLELAIENGRLTVDRKSR